jgi:hypothetical protein
MRALQRIPAPSKAKSPRRDIEQPVYPRRIAVQVTGIDVDVLRQWQFRGLLDHIRWDGCLIRNRQAQQTLRRYYSVLDLLKLSVMQELVRTGMRPEVAAESPALIEAVLSGEDLNALEHGRIPSHPLLFAKVADESLDLAYFVSLSGCGSPIIDPQTTCYAATRS